MRDKIDDPTCSASAKLRNLISGMRAAYARGENAMEFARRTAGTVENSTIASLIAYDLQAGSYVAAARANPVHNRLWCAQLAEILSPFISEHSSILEAGCGEATTLAGVVQRLVRTPKYKLGFDISWSRCAEGLDWLSESGVSARLFVADLFNIPLQDKTVDVVYTSHSLEPNGGRETDALRELIRVARRVVVLFEPIYELAHPEAQCRMRSHGYVRGLKEATESLGATVSDYRLLDCVSNPLNPSGVVLIEKSEERCIGETNGRGKLPSWRCPVTHAPLEEISDMFATLETGLAYPVLRGIPLLRSEHGIIASRVSRICGFGSPK